MESLDQTGMENLIADAPDETAVKVLDGIDGMERSYREFVGAMTDGERKRICSVVLDFIYRLGRGGRTYVRANRVVDAAVNENEDPYAVIFGFDRLLADGKLTETNRIVRVKRGYGDCYYSEKYYKLAAAVAVMNESGYLTPEDFENVDENSPEVKLYGKEYERWMGED